jgi:hypothetical protein
MVLLVQRLITDSKDSKTWSVPFVLWMDRLSLTSWFKYVESTLGRVIFGFATLYTQHILGWIPAYSILIPVIATATFIQIIIWSVS